MKGYKFFVICKYHIKNNMIYTFFDRNDYIEFLMKFDYKDPDFIEIEVYNCGLICTI